MNEKLTGVERDHYIAMLASRAEGLVRATLGGLVPVSFFLTSMREIQKQVIKQAPDVSCEDAMNIFREFGFE